MNVKNQKYADNLCQNTKERYEATYERFMQWRLAKKVNTFSEQIFLMYFYGMASNQSPSNLWKIFSILQKMFEIKHKLNISKYSHLMAFLRQINKGTRALTQEQINHFLLEAPDNSYLKLKVAVIFIAYGACSKHELFNLTVDDIEEKNDMIIVTIPRKISEMPRSFAIKNFFYRIYKNYADLRPSDVASRKFFINYCNGKCSSDVTGVNGFNDLAMNVAVFLKLYNPQSYNIQASRDCSVAAILCDPSADLLPLKRKASADVQDYVEDIAGNKKRIKLENSPPTNHECLSTNLLRESALITKNDADDEEEDEEIKKILKSWESRYRKLSKGQRTRFNKAINDVFSEMELPDSETQQIRVKTENIEDVLPADLEAHPTCDTSLEEQIKIHSMIMKSEESIDTETSNPESQHILVKVEEDTNICIYVFHSDQESESGKRSLQATEKQFYSIKVKSPNGIGTLPDDTGQHSINVECEKSLNYVPDSTHPDSIPFPLKMDYE